MNVSSLALAIFRLRIKSGKDEEGVIKQGDEDALAKRLRGVFSKVGLRSSRHFPGPCVRFDGDRN